MEMQQDDWCWYFLVREYIRFLANIITIGMDGAEYEYDRYAL